MLALRFRHYDREAGILRLEPGEAKNREGREFPVGVLPRLRQVLERQVERKRAFEKDRGRIVEHLFFDESGRPVRSFRKAWKKATKAAGVPNLLVHDLRRSFARRASRAGLSQHVIMRLAGWKTDSVFRRYAIVDQEVLEEGVEKLAVYDESNGGEPESKVVGIVQGQKKKSKGTPKQAGKATVAQG